MRIQMRTEGGFAYIPGLSRPTILDSATLSPQESDEIQHLVSAVHFFDLPTLQEQTVHGGDQRTYKITIEDGVRSHSIQVTDPVKDPQLQALLTFVQQHASM
ncbi:protealysin inhibitor emfourin [Dictyobacter arantiisoli]|uniref:Uncharacterized protein n=1 Tax=Dictyobacter arantiisoli TaxID=2014874 RepID=A0A5A5T567_9CHLR|nr:protealysin inhibitor emfourin [Dictyobacter arantiisoli]GCF06511.1 hypothetical protein KDI_00750 [Dictyobacter arantiisoli]